MATNHSFLGLWLTKREIDVDTVHCMRNSHTCCANQHQKRRSPVHILLNSMRTNRVHFCVSIDLYFTQLTLEPLNNF